MKHLVLTFILFGSFIVSNAQTPYEINQNTNKCCGGDNSGMGSSFLTSAAGKLDSIEVYIRTGTYSTGTLDVYEGNTNDSTALIYTQTLTGIPTGIGNAPYMAKLTSPVSLDSNSAYTFMIYNTPLRFGYSNTYADGSLWAGAGFLTAGEHPDKDLDFIAYIGNPVATGLPEIKKKISYRIEGNAIVLKNFKAEEIFLFDLFGRIIASGNGEKLILMGTYTEGIYILRARKGNERQTVKIYLKP